MSAFGKLEPGKLDWIMIKLVMQLAYKCQLAQFALLIKLPRMLKQSLFECFRFQFLFNCRFCFLTLRIFHLWLQVKLRVHDFSARTVSAPIFGAFY